MLASFYLRFCEVQKYFPIDINLTVILSYGGKIKKQVAVSQKKKNEDANLGIVLFLGTNPVKSQKQEGIKL